MLVKQIGRMELAKHYPGKGQVEYGARKTYNLTCSLYPADIELLEGIQEHLGCSRSEAMRTAIRSFAAHLAFLQGSRQK